MYLDGGDLAKLNNHQFRKVMNALLTVEADRNRVALTALDLTTRDTDPDAGVDALLQWPEHAPNDRLPAGEIVVQYKSGKLDKKDLEREFAKKGVQDTLRRKGSYLLLVGHDYVATTCDKHREELSRLCKTKRIAAKRCTILFGGQIARWASRYRSIALLPEFGKPLAAFVTVEEWRQDRLFQNAYIADASRKEAIAAIREFVSSPTGENVLRIEGPAGVGKSRLALEALSEPGVAEATIYAANADSQSVEDGLISFQGAGIIVVDECTSDRQDVLARYARHAGPGLRLICLGPMDLLTPVRQTVTKVYQLHPLADSDIRAILQAAIPQIPPEVVNTTVRVSGGYVKLALFVAQVLIDRNVSLGELYGIHDVRQVLKRFVPKGTAQTLQALSLLSRVGWEDELRGEAEALAKLAGLQFIEVQRAVRELRVQGVVLPRGRYLYVSPDLLAIKAAAELWDERGAELIHVVEDLPGAGPKRHLLIRLAMMADHAEVRKAVERLLGDDGLFKTIEDLDQEFLSEVFRILSAALPVAAATRLAAILADTPRSRLLSFRLGRRNVVWALESLLRWSETSYEAAHCLRQLALAENETFANSATGIFRQYFHIFLSGSPLPFFDRLPLLEDLVGSADVTARELAMAAAEAALNRYEMRLGNDSDRISLRSYPEEWRPRTAEEYQNAIRAALRHLKMLSVGSDAAAESARQALIDNASNLATDGLLEEAIEALESLSVSAPERLRARADAAAWIVREIGERLSESQRAALQRIVDSTFGKDLGGRLKRWVGARLDSDYELADGTGLEDADAKVLKLAEESYVHGLKDAELQWLSSQEAENVWSYGNRLGEIDADERYLERIIEFAPDHANCVFLAAYVGGLGSAKGEKRFDEICELLLDRRPFLAFGVTFRGPASVAAGRRVIRLIESGGLPNHTLQLLMYGGWVASLPAPEQREILSRLLDKQDEALMAVALSILHNCVKREACSIEGYADLIWRALEQPLAKSRFAGDWQWGELAKRLAHVQPERAASLTVKKLEDDVTWARFRRIGREVLSAATSANSEGVWRVVSCALLDRRTASYRLLLALEHWYGDLISPELLVQWASAYPAGRTIAPRLISLEGTPMPQRLRALLNAFPEDEAVVKSVLGSLGSGLRRGPYSGRLQKNRGILQSWADEGDPHVRKWALAATRLAEKDLEKQLKIEEEEGLAEMAAS